MLTDRIRADSEMVEQVLNPDRTDENVRYPDPAFPADSNTQSTAPDSLAAMKMARRTDAGRRQSIRSLGGAGPNGLLWIAAAVLVVAVFLVFVVA
jgi:hypothetical protein